MLLVASSQFIRCRNIDPMLLSAAKSALHRIHLPLNSMEEKQQYLVW
jgi:hypothetical protein